MQLKIGQKIQCRDMFMQTTHEYEVAGIFGIDDLILKRRNCYSRGQISFRLKGDTIEMQVRATTWHESIESLIEHWTVTKRPTVQTPETIKVAPTLVGTGI